MNKILVANRGEIALRIIKTIKKMGLKSVAVYSDCDKKMPFVTHADEAVCIGEPTAEKSYLNINKIIDVCKKLNVDALHPGYGFFSENAETAKLIKQAGINFIGPSAESMEIMGDKLAAKKAAKKYNIPLIEGSEGAISDIKKAKKLAEKIGYPLLIKAAGGGGGKGMKLVENEKDLKENMLSAMNESQAAFGSNSVFIEKYANSPKHIEIQILADKHGNIIYLFDRECSIQRRHQKVIEEAPSPSISEEIRQEMGETAIRVAKSCNYIGAGTVEFLVDDKKNIYFLEMNTRLQVEHPVTEEITGLDIVEQQILIAQNHKLNIKQSDLKINGHAIEVRVYAEDTENGFIPDTGKLEVYRPPKGKNIRLDDGYKEGLNIPIYYDPMISKVIVHENNRSLAIKTMLKAINNYKIKGIKTTLPFCSFVLKHKAFIDATFTTHFVKNYYSAENIKKQNKETEEIGAMFAFELYKEILNQPTLIKHHTNNWKNKLK